jgi:hypothetical protein
MRSIIKLAILAMLFLVPYAKGQGGPGGNNNNVSPMYPVTLFIKDPTIIYTVYQGKPIFTISGMNTLVDQYTVTGFVQDQPTSRLHVMREVYKMEVSDTALPAALVSSYPQYFTGWDQEGHYPLSFYYTPVDYPAISMQRDAGYLGYINAQQAWDVTKGDSNIIIRIHDVELDTVHPDLVSKLDTYRNTHKLWGFPNNNGHGTRTAGLIAGKTDNNTGSPYYGYYPSIGFNCKLDYVGCTAFAGDLYTQCPDMFDTGRNKNKRQRKIINFSGGHGVSDSLFWTNNRTFIGWEMLHQEIYENGALYIAAAGNGYSDSIWVLDSIPYKAVMPAYKYAFPASHDYVFSVSGLSWVTPGTHEKNPGDSFSSQQHNSRVDLLAPSFNVGGLDWFGGNRYSFAGSGVNGTSLAAPLVAGTAGLILSVDSCYTPYQLEYILKKSANDSVLSYPHNLKYAGKLGAGALNAEKAVKMADHYHQYPGIVGTKCNDPATKTFYIEGVDINTLCAPGKSSNGVKPTVTPIVRNGIPPYKVRWEAMPKWGNEAVIHSDTAFTATVDTVIINSPSLGGGYFVYRVTVYDGSPVQRVASRIIRFTMDRGNLIGRKYNLAGRDAYIDVYDEPNLMDTADRRDNNFFMSPDLWNRQKKDAILIHENAEYTLTDSNYAYVRIKNVGCSTYTALLDSNYLKLYWTVASTGEKWKTDWNGSGPTINGYPCGGEITNGNSLLIPNLDPGQEVMINKSWTPVDPQDYGVSDLNVCLLARITNTTDNTGIAEQLNKPVLYNVRASNNIFTRNLWVKDLYAGNTKAKTSLLIANVDDATRNFDLQFINDRAINQHFAGNFSAVGYVTLYLGDLYNVWMDAGGDGTYISRDDDTRSVLMDGSQTLELLNIPLEADARYMIDVEFSLHPNVEIPNYTYDFHLRQYGRDEDGVREDVYYGSMSFQINTVNEDAGRRKTVHPDEEAINGRTSAFSVYPNPASDKISLSYLSNEEVVVNVSVYDMTGRKIISADNQHFQNSFMDLDIANYAPGVYLINISDGKNINDRIKFIKR